MMEPEMYFAAENKAVANEYENVLTQITAAVEELNQSKPESELEEFYSFLAQVGQRITKMAEWEKELADNYFENTDFDTIKAWNREFYSEILDENYNSTFANPSYATEKLGSELGAILSEFYCNYRGYYGYALLHKRFQIHKHNKAFIEFVELIKNNGLDTEAIKKLVGRIPKETTSAEIALGMSEQYDPAFSYYKDIAENADPNDLRYLFRYGIYVSDDIIANAEFINRFPSEKAAELALLVANAYVRGFTADGKDLSKKSSVGVFIQPGYERILALLVQELDKRKLKAILLPGRSTPTNRQYQYDHRFSVAMVLDSEYSEEYTRKYVEAMSLREQICRQFSGPIVFELFGEPPFKPENKPECLKLSDEQQQLYQKMMNDIMMERQKYLPREETSFSIIAFPGPAIGENFPAIWEDIAKVNMLKSEEYSPIHQKIIDALDQGDYIHIKGKNENITDLKVKNQKLSDPNTQTLYENCGADVNIPLGEVFTTPKLTGTDGVLQVSENYLRGLRFVDLKLDFTNGEVSDYACANFDEISENRKYIEENLLFPHKSLPLGEFAIGTNTLAYVIARKHKILDRLPILILEKMGPHFAVGDSCFSRQEDRKLFNSSNQKEMIAKENERSVLRKEDPMKAYTNCHTDITLPYEEIEFIAAVKPDGSRINIIRDGRFVLPGTEILNKPFDS